MSNPLSMVGIPKDYMPVTPSDTVENTRAERVTVIGIYVEVGGNLCFETSSGDVRTLNLADNQLIPLYMPLRIRATGTTATGIHAAYA